MKDKNLKSITDFEPDALEIKNEKLPFLIKLCVWFPLILVTAAIIWACVTEIDVIVQGTGKIVTDRSTIVMKPLERSVIKSIDVKIGDVVKKDQILIVFDPAINNSEAERLDNEMSALTAQLNRLSAEFNSTVYSGGDHHFEKWQLAIYKQRFEYYKERINYFEAALAQIDASQKSRQDSLRKQKERLEAIKKLEDMYTTLQAKSAISLKDMIQMSISRMEMEATVDQLENSIVELNHQRGTIVAEKNSFVQEWRNSIAEDMVTVDRNLSSIKKEHEKVQQLIEYIYLRAPCDSVVHEIASFSPGSAVREAEALITLIPLEGNMELEAEIRPQDIGKVKKGELARIKISAYPFQKHGTLDGRVRNLSANTLEKDAGGQKLTYYRARVTVSGKLNNTLEEFALIPGMEAQCEIKCGTRRVIEYVLYPLIKALDETAKEP